MMLDSALLDINQIVAYEPTAEHHLERGRLFMKMNNKKLACADFTKAESLGLDISDYKFYCKD